ncbi:uncharacterized protein LOC141669824 isoform X2 [Apium graveolens]|uniref:uncharacterized protein LOC141669824 isoform X2 n=1 Tax=Apium graveolens TaxID=4045 RepID=UPI003D7A2449
MSSRSWFEFGAWRLVAKKDSDAAKEALVKLREAGWTKNWGSQPNISHHTIFWVLVLMKLEHSVLVRNQGKRREEESYLMNERMHLEKGRETRVNLPLK